MGLFGKSKKEITINSLFEEEEEKIICDGCSKEFNKSEMRKCKKCGAVLCPECRENHECNNNKSVDIHTDPIPEVTCECTLDKDCILPTPKNEDYIDEYEFSHELKLTEIIIPDSVKSIRNNAFSYCSKLTNVSIPNSVTSIAYGAFYGCSSLTSINIPNSVTIIHSDTFSGCKGLKSINIPNSVTSIGSGAFSGCTGLTSINIPNSVTSIESRAFNGCTGLTSINIPNSVTSIESRAFNGCTGLTSINIPDSITSIKENVFNGCTGLTSLNFPDSITSIKEGAFSGCTGLISINIPDSVGVIDESAFNKCINLESIYLTKECFDEFSKHNLQNLFKLYNLQIDTACYNESNLTNDLIGDGWQWIASAKTLVLNNYDGDIICSNSDISILLAQDSNNRIRSVDGAGIISSNGDVIIGGFGSLKIECFGEDDSTSGIKANSLQIKSGDITCISDNGFGVCSNEIIVSGGTIHAVSINFEAVNSDCKISCGNARMFAGDSQTSSRTVKQYLHEKYLCITFDESCNMDSSTIVNQNILNVGNVAEGAQIVAGDNVGAMIGADSIVNRSNISVLDKSDNIIEDSTVFNHDSNQNEEKQDYKYCIYCGEKLPVKARFCMKCGEKLE